MPRGSDFGTTLLQYGLDHHRDRLTDAFAELATLYIEQQSALEAKRATDELEETTTFQTRIIAEDPEGEQAIWELTMTLNPATPATRKYTPGREPPPEEPVEEAEEERRR